MELKPCPFCGDTDIVPERLGTNRASCIVVCQNCGCKLETNEIGYGYFWNNRFKPKAEEKEKDIQEICDDCCDSSIPVNNQYIGEVFQWLINNDYIISKK